MTSGMPVGEMRRCDAVKGNKQRCLNPAGAGTDHPGFGRCQFHGGKSPTGRRSAAISEARYNLRAYGTPVPIDPAEALVAEMARSNGILLWAQSALQDMSEENLFSYKGAALREIYSEERNRLTKIAKLCLDVGLKEREINLAEKMGFMIQRVLTQSLAQLDLPPEVLERAPEIIREQLQLVAGARHPQVVNPHAVAPGPIQAAPNPVGDKGQRRGTQYEEYTINGYKVPKSAGYTYRKKLEQREPGPFAGQGLDELRPPPPTLPQQPQKESA